MRISFCIKTDNNNIANEILLYAKSLKIDNLIIHQKDFSVYNNIFFHYLGDDKDYFYEKLSNLISNSIIKLYEKQLLYKIICENYFYFFDMEINDILKICLESRKEFNVLERLQIIKNECLEYISNNKSMILQGFVDFRLYDYCVFLDEIVDYSINKYLIQREYVEFINLLQDYVCFSNSTCNKVHLIYSEHNSILLDENNGIIPIEQNISNAKYLSDITFSKNDYCLNSLLNLLPSKIVIHLLCNKDEFIETIESIFCNKTQICNSCSLCLESICKTKVEIE